MNPYKLLTLSCLLFYAAYQKWKNLYEWTRKWYFLLLTAMECVMYAKNTTMWSFYCKMFHISILFCLFLLFNTICRFHSFFFVMFYILVVQYCLMYAFEMLKFFKGIQLLFSKRFDHLQIFLKTCHKVTNPWKNFLLKFKCFCLVFIRSLCRVSNETKTASISTVVYILCMMPMAV